MNMMTSQNLAIVFAPTILKPPNGYDPMKEMKDVQDVIKVVEFIIESRLFREVEGEEEEEEEDAGGEGKRVASYIKKKKKER